MADEARDLEYALTFRNDFEQAFAALEDHLSDSAAQSQAAQEALGKTADQLQRATEATQEYNEALAEAIRLGREMKEAQAFAQYAVDSGLSAQQAGVNWASMRANNYGPGGAFGYVGSGQAAKDAESWQKENEETLKEAREEFARDLDETKRQLESLDFAASTGGDGGMLSSDPGQQIAGALGAPTRLKGFVGQLTAVVATGTAAIGTIVNLTNEFREMDDSMYQVGRQTELTKDGVSELRDSLDDFAVGTGAKTTEQLNAIAAAAGGLGVRGKENIEAFVESIAKFEAVTGLSNTADQFGRILRSTNTSLNQVGGLGSAITAVAKNVRGASEGGILSGAQQASAILGPIGFDIDQIIGLTGQLSAIGVPLGRAQQSVGQLVQAIQVGASEGGDKLKVLADLTNMTQEEFRKFAGTEEPFKVLISVLRGLDEAMAGSNNKAGLSKEILSELGVGSSKTGTAINALARNWRGLEEAVAVASAELRNPLDLERDFETWSQKMSAQLKRVTEAWDAVRTNLGEGVAPIVSAAASGWASFLGVIAEALQGMNQWEKVLIAVTVAMSALVPFVSAVVGAVSLLAPVWASLTAAAGLLVPVLGLTVAQFALLATAIGGAIILLPRLVQGLYDWAAGTDEVSKMSRELSKEAEKTADKQIDALRRVNAAEAARAQRAIEVEGQLQQARAATLLALAEQGDATQQLVADMRAEVERPMVLRWLLNAGEFMAGVKTWQEFKQDAEQPKEVQIDEKGLADIERDVYKLFDLLSQDQVIAIRAQIKTEYAAKGINIPAEQLTDEVQKEIQTLVGNKEFFPGLGQIEALPEDLQKGPRAQLALLDQYTQRVNQSREEADALAQQQEELARKTSGVSKSFGDAGKEVLTFAQVMADIDFERSLIGLSSVEQQVQQFTRQLQEQVRGGSANLTTEQIAQAAAAQRGLLVDQIIGDTTREVEARLRGLESDRALAGQSDVLREQAQELFQIREQLREQGVDLYAPEAAALRELVEVTLPYQLGLTRQRERYEEIKRSVDDTLSSYEAERLTLGLTNEQRFVEAQAIEAAARARRDGAGDVTALTEALREEAAALLEAQRAAEQGLKGLSLGLRQSWEDYRNEGLNTAQATSDIFRTATQGMEDALFSFFKTGKAGWSEFATAIIDELQRVIIRMMVVYAIQKLIGFAGNFGGSGASSPGLTGQLGELSSLGNSLADSLTIPNAASGMLLRPRAGGTIVRMAEAGEAEVAMPESKIPEWIGGALARSGVSGQRPVQVTVSVTVNEATRETTSRAQQSDGFSRELAVAVGRLVDEKLIDAQRTGGVLNRTESMR